MAGEWSSPLHPSSTRPSSPGAPWRHFRASRGLSGPVRLFLLGLRWLGGLGEGYKRDGGNGNEVSPVASSVWLSAELLSFFRAPIYEYCHELRSPEESSSSKSSSPIANYFRSYSPVCACSKLSFFYLISLQPTTAANIRRLGGWGRRGCSRDTASIRQEGDWP
ncbi:uncharacterized protein BO97DRAFT_167346 [Aspergillus homomorphus CBS 101889]|uniref:Uncharacterized protein n=1 Tax=Aspergillus homomorphus (strain CBS 101889) TaxID=1450537 RepID=A0A395HP23_ASPHC|nr:hypothetical protein BO97DRAFT_167346 [Aspergillus homomorphus CBS 101889]RAL09567.1 hypothetical protein BO97DRAFT_167346 [Aspergillus homomorphus CBS 101889]